VVGLAVRVDVDREGAVGTEVNRFPGLVGGRLDRDNCGAGGHVEGLAVRRGDGKTVEAEVDRLAGLVGGDSDRGDRPGLADVWIGDVDGRTDPRPVWSCRAGAVAGGPYAHRDKDGNNGGRRGPGHADPRRAPPVPPPDLLDQVSRRLLVGYRRFHRGPQPPLEISHDSERLRICPAGASVPGPATSRSRARPRETWLFTVPTLHPSSSAISASGRSLKYLSTSTVRCRGGSAASARSRKSRSATASDWSGAIGSASPGLSWRSRRRATCRHRSFDAFARIRCTYRSGSPERQTRAQ